MDTLVLFFDEVRDEVDVEYNGVVINTVPYGTKFSAPGFSMGVNSEGDIIDEDYDPNVEVGAYQFEFVEYVFDKLDSKDIKVEIL